LHYHRRVRRGRLLRWLPRHPAPSRSFGHLRRGRHLHCRPYDCGEGNVIDFETCDLGISDPQLEAQAKPWASQGLIDSLSNLHGKPVYLYHGTLDPVVNPLVANAGVSWCKDFGANVEYHNWDHAGRSWVTPLGVVACPLTSAPFLNNSGDDPYSSKISAGAR
jgi:poly(3-hydroxybutyrate) depolymerase